MKMPACCAALGCKNSRYKEKKKKTKVTFHTFPADPVRREKWIKIMKLEDQILCKESFLCSRHFEEKFMDRTSLVKVRLRENAIPHLENTEYDEVLDQTDLIPVEEVKKEILEDDTGQYFSSETYSTCDKETNTSPLLLQEVQRPTVEKGTSVSPERIWNSSSAKTIQEANLLLIRNLKKEIKFLEQKVKEKDRKILAMKNILDELKVGYISDED